MFHLLRLAGHVDDQIQGVVCSVVHSNNEVRDVILLVSIVRFGIGVSLQGFSFPQSDAAGCRLLSLMRPQDNTRQCYIRSNAGELFFTRQIFVSAAGSER